MTGTLWCHVRRAAAAQRADVTVFDDSGAVVADITGIRCAPAPATEAPPRSHDDYAVAWRDATITPGPVPSGDWLLLDSGTDFDEELTRNLTTAGCSVVRLAAGGDSSALTRALGSHPGPAAVVNLSALSCATDRTASAREVQWAATDLCSESLTVARAVASARTRPSLFVLTRGAAPVAGAACTAPWQAARAEFELVMGRENDCRTITLDLDSESADPVADAAAVTAVLLSNGSESRLARRGDHWLAPRLTPTAEMNSAAALHVPRNVSQPSSRDDAARILRTDSGIEGLALTAGPRPAPGPGQVEIAISHAGLNFHDLLVAVYGVGAPDPFGAECAGVVSRLGSDVHDLAVGAEVFAYAWGTMRSHVVVDARLVLPRPENLTPAEAAAIPVVYGTAYHALVERAQLRAGERILIHSATGGLGMAALHIARRLGAVVYATAGTETKRDMLRKLGAAKVSDSRSLQFAEDFGDGVDVILNTLTGAAVEANFSILRPFGRYLDVTVRETGDEQMLSSNLFVDSRSYLHVRLHDYYNLDPQRLGEVLRAVTDLVAREELPPPLHRVFPMEDASEAFGLMLRSGHVGKLVLAMPSTDRGVPSPADAVVGEGDPAVRPDATYLVTGGLSGVGALCAQWLIGRGCRYLVLTGRREIDPASYSTDPRAEMLRRLRAGGAQVHYAATDVGDTDAMAELVTDMQERQGFPRFAGVVHSAAVLVPTGVGDLTTEIIDQTLHPKVAGGWALHAVFAERPLDFFVLFSSAVSVLADTSLSHQLGAYAAGNAFLDALAEHRRGLGLPATVVNWGYWSEVGLAARLSAETGHEVRPPGMKPILPARAGELFDRMLSASGRMIHVPVDWAGYLDAYPADAETPILRELAAHSPGEQSPGNTQPAPEPVAAPAPAVQTVTPPTPPPPPTPVPSMPAPAAADDRVGTLEEYLATQVAHALGWPPEQVDHNRAMNRLGLDSLMAADIRARLQRDQDCKVTVPELLGTSTVRELARRLGSVAAHAGAE